MHVVSDCVTSYDLKKMPEMLSYYAEKGCEVRTLAEYMKHVETVVLLTNQSEKAYE